MIRKRLIRSSAVVAVLALALAACGGNDEGSTTDSSSGAEPSGTAPTAPAEVVEIAYTSHVMDITDTYGQMLEGLTDALDALFGSSGYRLITGVSQGSSDLEGLDRIMNDVITAEPDYAITGMPAYAVFEPLVQRLIDSGIKVIVPEYAPEFLDSVNIDPLTWVTYSHAEMGLLGGEFIAQDRCNGDDFTVIVFWGLAASEIGLSRGEAFLDALEAGMAGCSNTFTVIDEVYADFDREKSFRLAEQMPTKHRQIDVIVGMNSNTALGIMEGLRSAGALDGIDIVGMGGQLDEAAAICRGDIRVAGVRDARNMGKLAAEAIYADVNGLPVPDVSLISLATAHDCETVFGGMPAAMLEQPLFKDNVLPGQYERYASE